VDRPLPVDPELDSEVYTEPDSFKMTRISQKVKKVLLKKEARIKKKVFDIEKT
jgi:hypothetical protein